jgi:hypothetical protein
MSMGQKEIAERISEHLKRFEADPVINAYREGTTLSPYYNARAYHAGRWVRVTYISFQGSISLSKQEALDYLEWLDAGNVGRHFDQQREKES